MSIDVKGLCQAEFIFSQQKHIQLQRIQLYLALEGQQLDTKKELS